MSRTGTPAFHRLTIWLTYRWSSMNQNATSIPTVSLSIRLRRCVRQFVTDESHSDSARAGAATPPTISTVATIGRRRTPYGKRRTHGERWMEDMRPPDPNHVPCSAAYLPGDCRYEGART